MRVAPIALLACVSLASWAGCAASGNDIPDDSTTGTGSGDGGTRRVVTSQDDPFDSGTNTSYDAGSSRPTDAGTKTDSASPLAQCDFQTGQQGSSCAMASDIGSVSGDTDPSQNSITYTGTTSQWLVVNVTEDSNSVVEHDLMAKFTLTNPPGTNYDLAVYVDPSGTPTSRSCQTVSGQSQNAAGMDDVVGITWDDNQVSQPNIDTRLVSVKIEWVSGPCGAGNGWSLRVDGHTK